jgi:hypothetical protein
MQGAAGTRSGRRRVDPGYGEAEEMRSCWLVADRRWWIRRGERRGSGLLLHSDTSVDRSIPLCVDFCTRRMNFL